jgi:AcrR family transcriptional regulator
MRTVNAEQHARKRQAILEAAAVEFALNGVDGTSTAGVCRRAGIGSGTLFHYFPTKIDIFHALFGDDLARNAAVAAEALALPARDGLNRLVDHLTSDFGDPLVPGLMAAALVQVNRDEVFATMLAEDEAVVRRALTLLLERLAADGSAPTFAPQRTARWIQRIIDACYLAAGDDAFDAGTSSAELRQLLDWLVGQDANS